MWQEAFKSAKKGATFKSADFFFNFTWNCVTQFTQFDDSFYHMSHWTLSFLSKLKCHCFTKYFSGFMSRMHKLQIFREKLQFSCIAFRLENPTQALPSRHWFHHHNSQCFFFFQLSCHSSPQVMLLEHAWHLSQSFWWYDDDLRHHFSRHFRKWCQERGKNWVKSSKKENVWHQMVTQHQTSSL